MQHRDYVHVETSVHVHTNLPQLANLYIYLQTGSKCIGIASSATDFTLPAVQGGTQCSYYLCTIIIMITESTEQYLVQV